MEDLKFRPAEEQDCTDLVLFADMATRRLTSHLWDGNARPGQSAFEIGRDVIRTDAAHFMHYKNWRVAVRNGRTIGGVNCNLMPEPIRGSAQASEFVRGLNELKAIAAGTWYIACAALHSEYQGHGFGGGLLAEAERLARSEGASRMTLMVGSFNLNAGRLYHKLGFSEWERRPFTAFAGSDPVGDWILMVRDLA